MMISCAPADRERVMPILAKMTGKVIDLGDDPIRAATFKLFGNRFIVTLSSSLGDFKRFAG